MSIEAIAWAFKQPINSAAKKFVLVALADNADGYGVCFPSYKHIQEKTGLSRRAVVNNIAALVDDGYMVKVNRVRLNQSYTSNAYRLSLPDTTMDDHPLNDLFVGGSAPDALGVVHEVHHPSAPDAPLEPSLNLKKEKKALTRSDFLREIDAGRVDDAYAEFAHLTETEIMQAAAACFDHWAAKGEFPAGEPAPVFRNWLRHGIRKGAIRKAGIARQDTEQPAQEAPEVAQWRGRVKAWLDSPRGMSYAWSPKWGPEPDQPDTTVPPEILAQFSTAIERHAHRS